MKIDKKTILVTGGAGFLGSVLVPMLLKKGFKVIIYDRFFFGLNTLRNFQNHDCLLINGDTRWISRKILKGVEIIFDLASISNDPSGELDTEITMNINFKARVRLTKMAKKIGIKKYIMASTCSVYGFQKGLIKESRKTKPLTTYARAASLAEKAVLKLSDKNFSVTVLRQGTLFGLSPRMRFDVVVNTMILSLFQKGELTIYDGQQWRPLVHVEDSAKAFIAVATAKPSKVNGHIFNVGSTKQNFQILDLAKKIIKYLKIPAKINILSVGYDSRSYSVSCDKITRILNFTTERSIKDGAIVIMGALKRGQVVDSIECNTLELYKKLLDEDPNLFKKRVEAKILEQLK